MQRLLGDIQKELDQCWAVMGETYGRFSPFNDLGITIRRVRSNIDDPSLFKKQRNPSYLPKEYKFRTASAELMDLLVAPLYGEKPEVGIRELIQNAVDACLERDDLSDKGLIRIEKPTDDVIVTLAIPADGTPSITIEDFGVGMTPSVVENYFLNIGASFRSSDLWRKNHEVGGHSTIHRTGRFGIGILAAYLLGDEVKVTTRHVSCSPEEGISFICTQGDEAIEIRPCNFRAGTKIEIEISSDIAKQLLTLSSNWDWHCLDSPKVRRRIVAREDRLLPQRYTVPGCDADLSATKWRRVAAEEYDDLMWSYEAMGTSSYYNRALICNGIFVATTSYLLTPKVSPGLHVIRASSPSLVVFDPDGRFPINLQRDQILTEAVSFERALAVDVSHYFISKLVEALELLPAGANKESVSLSVHPRIPGLSDRTPNPSLANVILRPDGVLPVDLDLLREAKPTSVVIDAVNLAAGRGAFTSSHFVSWVKNYVAANTVSHTKMSRTEFIRDSLGIGNYQSSGYLWALPIAGRRIFMRKADVTELVTPGNVPRTQWAKLTLEEDFGHWGLWSTGSLPKVELDLRALATDLDKNQSFGLTILYIDWESDSQEESGYERSPFAEAWMQTVKSAVLPQRL